MIVLHQVLRFIKERWAKGELSCDASLNMTLTWTEYAGLGVSLNKRFHIKVSGANCRVDLLP